MKKILSYALILVLSVLAVSCEKGPEGPTMAGVYYASIPGTKQVVELFPGGSKTFDLRAYAEGEKVADAVLNISFKADPSLVEKFNEKNGTSFVMCPGSAYEFLSNEVMMPRYGKSSTTARVKVIASGIEDNTTYILPVAIDKISGSDICEAADTISAYVVFKKSDIDPSHGLGTADSPYQIKTAEDLAAMSSKFVDGSMVYFKLMNDLDMSDVTSWHPVNEAPFGKFDFDGGGHTISNFKSNCSLFGAVIGKIHDISVVDAVITNASESHSAILAAFLGDDGMPSEAEHCHVQGKVTNTVTHGTAGLFGVICEATVNACSADVIASAERAKYDVGGIFGYDTGVSTVTNCWSAGECRGNRYVGGIGGNLTKAGSSIYNCYTTTAVYGQFQYGGLIGIANLDQKTGNADNDPGNHIEKCIVWNEIVSTVTTDDAAHYSAGGVVGATALKNYLVDCYRRPDLNFIECPGNAFNVLYDQPNSSPSSPLVEVDGQYNFPYHGKAAPEGSTVSSVAKSLGWDEGIWVLTGSLPFFKGASAPEDNPDATPGGQLPDFDENEFYK